MPNKITFRKANWLDCIFLYNLRNKPETYKYFRNNYPVDFFDHLKWFSGLMANKSDKKLFVVFVDGKRAGQIRFDKIESNKAEISISILKELMGKHVMSSVFPEAAKSYLKENKSVKTLIAPIRKDNTASINFFRKFGFKKSGEKENWLIYSKAIK